MEDLPAVLARHFLYKKRNEPILTTKDRITEMKEIRKNHRLDATFAKRKIPENMSPVVTPLPKKEKIQETKIKEQPATNKRLEMLAKWKSEKEKRKALQKKASKPIFKVTHVPVSIGLPNLETVNTEIKGKAFKSKFAPPNHKFKPPANIKPINFNNQVPAQTPKTAEHRMVTRSQTKGTSMPKSTPVQKTQNVKSVSSARSKVNKKEQKGPKEATRNKVNKEEQKGSKEVKEENVQVLEIKTEDKENIDTNGNSVNTKTPEKSATLENPPTYISPFVTLSRGKNSARKEYQARKSRQSFTQKPDTPDYASPKAGARYFTWLLDNQIARLEGICNQWTKYKTEMDPPEEAISMIDVAIGQTNLLITKKFVQFRGLIERCKAEDAETPVTCEDLHGFWDMMHIQVKNLDKRFENLDALKANNWQEVLPEVTKPNIKKKGRAPKNVKASSALKAAIEAARRKKQNENQKAPETPQRLIAVKTDEKGKRNSSPGLMMMKVAQYAKGVETPGKSILKDANTSLQKSKSKIVFFRDDVLTHKLGSLEKICINEKGNTPTRRSQRLSRNKLF